MFESFGFLNDLFPFPSILDAGYGIAISGDKNVIMKEAENFKT